jgi:hypothetical protein
MLCTLHWNVLTKKVTLGEFFILKSRKLKSRKYYIFDSPNLTRISGAFSTRSKASADDLLMLRLCKNFELHSDPRNNTKFDYVSVLNGCACSGSAVHSNQVVEEIDCCCIPRAMEYMLSRLGDSVRLKKYHKNEPTALSEKHFKVNVCLMLILIVFFTIAI